MTERKLNRPCDSQDVVTTRLFVADRSGAHYFHYRVTGLACDVSSRSLRGVDNLERPQPFSYPVDRVVVLNADNKVVQEAMRPASVVTRRPA
jgi:hypothetical protein